MGTLLGTELWLRLKTMTLQSLKCRPPLCLPAEMQVVCSAIASSRNMAVQSFLLQKHVPDVSHHKSCQLLEQHVQQLMHRTDNTCPTASLASSALVATSWPMAGFEAPLPE